jgi:hypothetical protein
MLAVRESKNQAAKMLMLHAGSSLDYSNHSARGDTALITQPRKDLFV